ncbi:MAG: hypothetical protein U0992_24565 [Planctomycetaceae bacterium]
MMHSIARMEKSTSFAATADSGITNQGKYTFGEQTDVADEAVRHDRDGTLAK